MNRKEMQKAKYRGIFSNIFLQTVNHRKCLDFFMNAAPVPETVHP